MRSYYSASSYAGDSSSGAITVPNDLIFTSNIQRDTFFNTNPSILVDDLFISVGGQLQKYVDDVWKDVSAVIKGESGQDAEEVKFQYSANGDSGWSDSLNSAIHKYWRWSTDGGLTWKPVPPQKAKYSADSSGGGVPEPFEYAVSPSGKLQLLKDGAVIQEQDETGAWIANSVATGTGSLHFGDLHSVGSGGENITFLNTDSNIAWYPTWAGVSTDGVQSVEMSSRWHGDLLNSEPVGLSATSGSVPYLDTFTAASDVAFFYLDIIPTETFNGRLRWIATKSTGKEVASFYFDADYTSGLQGLVPFKYPLWISAGQSFTVEIIKDDGSKLSVRPSLSQPTKPWRRTHYREFVDYKVFHENNPELQAQALNSLTGSDRLSANAIRDFPIMSSTVLGMAKLGTTMSIDGNGVINTAISPTGIKIVADEAARLSIPVSGGAILSIQQDNGFTYGIEAGEDTSVTGNWKQIGTVATNVVSFNGRNGAVVPTAGDYELSQIKVVNDDTGVIGKLGYDAQGLYFESV